MARGGPSFLSVFLLDSFPLSSSVSPFFLAPLYSSPSPRSASVPAISGGGGGGGGTGSGGRRRPAKKGRARRRFTISLTFFRRKKVVE